MLGVRPAVGRFFSDYRSDPDNDSRVAVLDWGLWKKRYGGDPSIIGRECWIGNRSFVIVGVAPRGFSGTERRQIDAWLPLQQRILFRFGPLGWPITPATFSVRLVARLRGSISIEQAESAAGILVASKEDSARSDQRIGAVKMLPVSAPVGWDDPVVGIAGWSAAASFLLLLISAASVANLLLFQNHSRMQELGVRRQLGATYKRLVRQLLTESLFLTLVGSLFAVLVFFASVSLFSSFLLERAPASRDLLDVRVTVLLVTIVPLTAVLVGVVPALKAARAPVLEILKGLPTGRLSRSRMQQAFLVVQVALAFVLLVGSGLFLRSLAVASRLDLGLEPEKVLVIRLPSTHNTNLQEGQIGHIFDLMLERVRLLPRVEAAGLNTSIPGYLMFAAGRHSLPGRPRKGVYRLSGHYVTPGYFQALGTRLLKGRVFTSQDMPGAELVAVVNRQMGGYFWPGEDPIGQCIHMNERSECTRVVGLVENSLAGGVTDEPQAQLYLPLAQQGVDRFRSPPPVKALFVRAASHRAVVETLSRDIAGMMGEVPYLDARLLSSYLESQYQPWIVGTAIFGYFGVLALVVAMVGLYAQVSFFVKQRIPEIGIRRAFGAPPTSIALFVFRRAATPAAVGITIGLGAALWMSKAIQGFLFGVTTADPWTLAGVSLLLFSIALVACFVPIRQTWLYPPVEVLKA